MRGWVPTWYAPLVEYPKRISKVLSRPWELTFPLFALFFIEYNKLESLERSLVVQRICYKKLKESKLSGHEGEAMDDLPGTGDPYCSPYSTYLDFILTIWTDN